MLQKNEKYLKKNGKFDIDPLIDECFLYASRILQNSKQVTYRGIMIYQFKVVVVALLLLHCCFTSMVNIY